MIRVQREDFDIGVELARLTDPHPGSSHGAGGLCAFVGLVRDINADAALAAMTLEHYPGMTERELAGIEGEARARWPLIETLIVHRYGRLEPGDRIVLVAATSAHREAAFDACRFLIDWLKTRAPFWKVEETAAGRRWVEASGQDQVAARRWQNRPAGTVKRSP